MRQTLIRAMLLVAITLAELSVFAVPNDLPIVDNSPEAQSSALLAAGFSLGLAKRQDYGDSSFFRFTPELLVHSYYGLSSEFYLRPGARFSYAWTQPEMPKSLQVREKDFGYSAELGVLYESYVVPSVTLGIGAISRSVTLITKKPIDASSAQISGNQTLPFLSLQAGVGVPLWNGFFVIEPYVRYQFVRDDKRMGLGFGLELTVQVL